MGSTMGRLGGLDRASLDRQMPDPPPIRGAPLVAWESDRNGPSRLILSFLASTTRPLRATQPPSERHNGRTRTESHAN